MSEKKDDPADGIPVYVGEMQIGSAEIPMPVWAVIGGIVGIIAVIMTIIAYSRR